MGPVGTSTSIPSEIQRRLDGFNRPPAQPNRLPLVGRSSELLALQELVHGAEGGQGSTVLVKGSRGVGKTRLGEEIASFARGRGWAVLCGHAYPSERFVPFAPFADAFLPLLRGVDVGDLETVAPGGVDAICALFPAIGSFGESRASSMIEPEERRSRLYWHFTEMLDRLARCRPILLVLEDLDFADRSSIELLHFLARRCGDSRIVAIGQYSGWDLERSKALVTVEHSLRRIGAAQVIELEPLGESDTRALVDAVLDVDDEAAASLTRIAHHWTRGNPFFLEGTLKSLRASIVGADVFSNAVDALELPHSVRDAILVWVGGVSPEALEAARLLAVMGSRMSHELLEQVSGLSRDAFVVVIDELARHEIVDESESGWTVDYDFRHPLIRETLRAELSLAARRRMHSRVGESLERLYGTAADEHADQLAYHFDNGEPEHSAKAVQYLVTAGRRALARQANEEAADYMQHALERIEAAPRFGPRDQAMDERTLSTVLRGLARARRRVGDLKASVALWRRALRRAETLDDHAGVAALCREIGLTHMGSGDLAEALEAFERSLSVASSIADVPMMIRVQLAQCLCHQFAGRPVEAEEVGANALTLAEGVGSVELLGRVHGALIRLNIWTGRIDQVRHHATIALDLGRRTGDLSLEFWSHWAVAATEGLLGNTDRMAERIERARAVSGELGSPVLELATDELAIELAFAQGRWEPGIEMAERAIGAARSLNQRTVLPRLLVWLSLMRIGRGEMEEADRLTTEAWELSGAAEALHDTRFIDVHTVVPAHIGRATYHLRRGDWSKAVSVAEAGLEIADRTGYVVWAMHHLLPIIAEASVHARDLEKAAEVGARIRAHATELGHALGLAWAEAGEAILTWLQGNASVGAEALRRAAESMERIPMTYEAARLRRQLAGRLADIGDREGALRELRMAYDVFRELGARPELEKALLQFGELGEEAPA